MQEKGRLNGKCGDLRHRLSRRRDDILIRIFSEPDVAVADLHETQIGFHVMIVQILPETGGGQDPAAHGPEHPRSDPGHALEKSPPVDAVAFVVMIIAHLNFLSFVWRCYAKVIPEVAEGNSEASLFVTETGCEAYLFPCTQNPVFR